MLMCPKNIFRTSLFLTDVISLLSVEMHFKCKVDVIALSWMADIMPNVTDGVATVAHNILPEICYIFGRQVKQPLWQMLGHLVMSVYGT